MVAKLCSNGRNCLTFSLSPWKVGRSFSSSLDRANPPAVFAAVLAKKALNPSANTCKPLVNGAIILLEKRLPAGSKASYNFLVAFAIAFICPWKFCAAPSAPFANLSFITMPTLISNCFIASPLYLPSSMALVKSTMACGPLNPAACAKIATAPGSTSPNCPLSSSLITCPLLAI